VQGCAKTETEKAIQKQSREQKTEAGKRTNKLKLYTVGKSWTEQIKGSKPERVNKFATFCRSTKWEPILM